MHFIFFPISRHILRILTTACDFSTDSRIRSGILPVNGVETTFDVYFNSSILAEVMFIPHTSTVGLLLSLCL